MWYRFLQISGIWRRAYSIDWRVNQGVEERLGIAGSGAIACGLARAAAAIPRGGPVGPERGLGGARRRTKVEDRDGRDGALGAAGCTIVVEAISEDVGTKRELYAPARRRARRDAVLATTTSSLSVAELAEASGRPDRFGALHVFNPVDKMKLVELSFPRRGERDDEGAAARALRASSTRPPSRCPTPPASW